MLRVYHFLDRGQPHGGASFLAASGSDKKQPEEGVKQGKMLFSCSAPTPGLLYLPQRGDSVRTLPGHYSQRQLSEYNPIQS